MSITTIPPKILKLITGLSNEESIELIPGKNLVIVKRLGKKVSTFPLYLSDKESSKGVSNLSSPSYFQESEERSSLNDLTEKRIKEERLSFFASKILEYLPEYNEDINPSSFYSMKYMDILWYAYKCNESKEIVLYSKSYNGNFIPSIILDVHLHLKYDLRNIGKKTKKQTI